MQEPLSSMLIFVTLGLCFFAFTSPGRTYCPPCRNLVLRVKAEVKYSEEGTSHPPCNAMTHGCTSLKAIPPVFISTMGLGFYKLAIR